MIDIEINFSTENMEDFKEALDRLNRSIESLALSFQNLYGEINAIDNHWYKLKTEKPWFRKNEKY